MREFFRELDQQASVPAGVCTLQNADTDWVVCPRRLFQLSATSKSDHADFCRQIVQRYMPTVGRDRFAVWSEVRLKFRKQSGDLEGEADQDFDYRFDYVVSRVDDLEVGAAAQALELEEGVLRRSLKQRAVELRRSSRGREMVPDCPIGAPLVIEVMTSSTSGGNKDKSTTISQAFQNALLGQSHCAPGINYRQVWARMVSQLFVKSQVGREWGGHTLWIVQDSLAEYMSRTTALRLSPASPSTLSDINILSLGLEEPCSTGGGVAALRERALYCGALPSPSTAGDFVNLLLASTAPPRSALHRVLVARDPEFVSSIGSAT
jgi:hypothetical protein